MNERIVSYVRNPWITLTTGGVVGAVIGAVSMDIFRRRQLGRALEVLEDEAQIQQLHLDFESKMIEEEMEPAPNVVTDLKGLQIGHVAYERVIQPTAEQLEEFEEHSGSAEGELNVVEHNIFDGDDSWDYSIELKNRNPARPYIIHVDEYTADERGYNSQSTLTWYEGDQILTDSNDVPIYNPKEVVGELNWGHGSGDPNVVFVRNERLKAEYEILRDFTSYQDTVLGGLEVEEEYARSDLKHSRQPLRFRE